MSEIKDYGEPWAYNNDRTPSMERSRPAYQDRDGKTILGKSNYADDGAVRDRALSCVNALAGRDPAKLDGLLEAVRYAVRNVDTSALTNSGYVHVPVVSWTILADALAAFEGGDK